MADRYTKYWHEGVAARRRGEPVTACPYNPDTPEASRWRVGWKVNTSRKRYGAVADAARAALLKMGATVPANIRARLEK